MSEQGIFTMELPSESGHQQAVGINNGIDVASCKDERAIFNLDFFRAQYWLPIVTSEQGKSKYAQFLDHVLKYVRSDEASIEAGTAFFTLLNSSADFDFMGPAIQQMPELDYMHLDQQLSKSMAFLVKLVSEARDQKLLLSGAMGSGESTADAIHKHGLNREETEPNSETMVGPGGSGGSPKKMTVLELLQADTTALLFGGSAARATNTELLRRAPFAPYNLGVPYIPQDKDDGWVEPPSRWSPDSSISSGSPPSLGPAQPQLGSPFQYNRSALHRADPIPFTRPPRDDAEASPDHELLLEHLAQDLASIRLSTQIAGPQGNSAVGAELTFPKIPVPPVTNRESNLTKAIDERYGHSPEESDWY